MMQRLFSTYRFASLALTTLLLTAVFLALMLVLPVGEDTLGAFAEEFKTWCFGYDPATGSMEWAYVTMFLAQPLMLAAVIGAVWWSPLREAGRRALAPWVGGGVVLFLLSVGSLLALQPARADLGELPFPAEGLRTEIPAPPLALENQDGETVDLAALRGQVVLITATYARCGDTCPMIFAQTRAAMDALTPEQQASVRVLGISLDPANDSREVRAKLASGQKIAAPVWNLLGGPPAVVEETLRDLGFAWTRDPKSGMIDHANLFLLVDRGGRIAYRFSLGKRQQSWLIAGLQTLLAEEAAS